MAPCASLCIWTVLLVVWVKKNCTVNERDSRDAPESRSGCWAPFAARTVNLNDTEGTAFHGTRGLNTAGIWRHRNIQQRNRIV